MKKINLSFLFLLPFFCFSQEQTITVIIDSVYQVEKDVNFNIDYSYGSIYGELLTKKSFNNYVNTISENIISFNGQISVNSENTVILIPFDNKNGSIKISNLSSLKNNDTLRINKIDIFKSDIIDTTFTLIKYFKYHNDSISKNAYRIKKTKKIDARQKKSVTIPKHINLNVNNINYTIEVSKIKSSVSEVITFNGQKPRKSSSPRIVFYGRTEKTNWIYEGILNLKTQ
jgi:hypothetical protein